MTDAWDIAADDTLRSAYVRKVLIGPRTPYGRSRPSAGQPTPRVLVQYWNDSRTVPRDVRGCIETWAGAELEGFAHSLFDDESAAEFIDRHFGLKHLAAFRECEHPAMRADYFRLCYMFSEGGIYIDADDEHTGLDLDPLVQDGRLLLAPLCYDITSDSMADPLHAAHDTESVDTKIFYTNNNPLIGPAGHPLIRAALDRATTSLLNIEEGNRDIQSLTGPGNLTACLVAHAVELESIGSARDFALLDDWNSFAVSNWQLQYRSDERNWRRWINQPGGTA